jgi:glycosyltransferase involved in cell wall biosynthesis
VRVLGALLRRIDAFVAKRAKAVVVLSPNFAGIYEHDRGVESSRVHVIPNWIDDIAPDAEAGRAYRQACGLPNDAFVIAYGGNIGVAAAVEQLIEAFRSLDERFHLIVAGSGPRADACRALAREIAPGRIHFEDPWPVELTSTVLSAADLLALPTLAAQSAVSVPSKLLTYLLMNKPVLAIASRDSEIARVIAEANAGWSVEAQELVNAIRVAASSSTVHGGREYALRMFSREACLSRVVELLE